jgi:hypothetical protein
MLGCALSIEKYATIIYIHSSKSRRMRDEKESATELPAVLRTSCNV